MTKNIFDTSLPNNWSTTLAESFLFDCAAEHFDKIAHVVFTATAEALGAAKSKAQPTAFVYRKENGDLAAAAIVQYFPNEDASNPGNWNLSWTFYEEDIPENSRKIDLNDANALTYYRAVAGSKWNIEFDNTSVIAPMVITTLTELKKWLDENAKENEEVSVEVPAVLTASVAVENGVKVFALTAAGEVKMAIKDDASIEV